MTLYSACFITYFLPLQSSPPLTPQDTTATSEALLPRIFVPLIDISLQMQLALLHAHICTHTYTLWLSSPPLPHTKDQSSVLSL